ncbi:unnamed protein product, partial [marine sediment metagenome]
MINHLLKEVMNNPEEPIQEFGYTDLSASLQKNYTDKVRFIACYNKDVALTTRRTRSRNTACFQELMGKTALIGDLKTIKKSNDRLKSFLNKKHMTKFYKLNMEKAEQGDEVYILKVEEMKDAIEKEESLDGRYFIQTEVSEEMDKEEIEWSYKCLQKVERAFRFIKHELDIRPVHVRKETRIRGHVMISYFGLLTEVLTEKKLKEVFPDAYDREQKWIKKIRR